MSDEDNQDQPVQEVDWESRAKAIEAEHSEAQSEIKRLVAENKKYRERAQNAEFSRLKTLYPQLEPDDIAGLNAEQVEKLAAKLTAKAQEDEQPQQPTPDKTQAAPFASSAGGQAPPPREPISFEEAKRLGGLSNPEVRQLVAQGLVEGVAPPA